MATTAEFSLQANLKIDGCSPVHLLCSMREVLNGTDATYCALHQALLACGRKGLGHVRLCVLFNELKPTFALWFRRRPVFSVHGANIPYA